MKEPKIKGSEKVGSIKKGSSDLSSRMKRGLSRTKDTVKNLSDDGQVTPEEYAEDSIKDISQGLAEDTAHDTASLVKKAAGAAKKKAAEKLRSSKAVKEKRKSPISSEIDSPQEGTLDGEEPKRSSGKPAKSSKKPSANRQKKAGSKTTSDITGDKKRKSNSTVKSGSKKAKLPAPKKERKTGVQRTPAASSLPRSHRKPLRYNASPQPNDKGRAAQESYRQVRAANDSRREEAIRQSERSARGAIIKTAKRDIKTVSHSVDRSIKKAPDAAARAAQRVRANAQKTARAAEKSAKAVKKSSEASAKTARRTARATAAAVRRIIAALRSSGSAAIAGGFVSIVVILVIALAGSILNSAFGIFAGDPSSEGGSLSEVIAEINNEYFSTIENEANAVQAGNYDGKRIFYMTDDDGEYPSNNWNDVLSVYSVLVTMDDDEPSDVVILTDANLEKLREVFEQMNTYDITSVGSVDEDTEKNILNVYVTQHTMSYIEAAAHFNMSETQIEVLNEMMSPKYQSMFASLVGVDVYSGSDTGDILDGLPNDTGSNVVRAALSKLGAPYVRGARGPNSFDCSGLAWWAINQADPELASHFHGCAADQAHYCKSMTVDRSQLRPGDLVFWHYTNCSGCGRWNEIHHVGIYAGQGKTIEASSSQGRVVIRDLWESSTNIIFMCARPYR